MKNKRVEIAVGYARNNWRVALEDFGMITLPVMFEQKSSQDQVKLRVIVEEIPEGGEDSGRAEESQAPETPV